jgi:urease accessory protein
MTETNWHGNLELVYTSKSQQTLISHAVVKAPLKIQRPFYPEGQEVCHSIALHTAGGIVGGDLLTQKIQLQPHANAVITTAAATKIYRSSGNWARQAIKIEIEPQATLEWLPQETIVFAGAKYHQDLQIELAPTASYCGWEITRFGRTARQEKFLEGEWRSNTEIWQNGVPLWIDRQFLHGSEASCSSLNALAGSAVVGTFIYLGRSIDRKIIPQVRHFWSEKGYPGNGGVTEILHGGLLCRYRGNSTSNVRHWFTEIWHLLRSSLFDRSMIRPRVW